MNGVKAYTFYRRWSDVVCLGVPACHNETRFSFSFDYTLFLQETSVKGYALKFLKNYTVLALEVSKFLVVYLVELCSLTS